VQPNAALAAGDLDANSYQHKPYLDQQIKDRGYKLVVAAYTVNFPIGIYSKKVKSLDELKEHARVDIPNDPTNGGRVLLETHCLDWPEHLGAEGGYGKIVRVDLLHKLHDELKYDSLDALTAGIARGESGGERGARPRLLDAVGDSSSVAFAFAVVGGVRGPAVDAAAFVGDVLRTRSVLSHLLPSLQSLHRYVSRSRVRPSWPNSLVGFSSRHLAQRLVGSLIAADASS